MNNSANPAPKSKQKKEARDLRAEASKIANSIKIEGQTAAETKAIATGIQRGLELFLRQQSEKTRELDKKIKKVKKISQQLTQQPDASVSPTTEFPSPSRPWALWLLAGLSWALFFVAGWWLHATIAS